MRKIVLLICASSLLLGLLAGSLSEFAPEDNSCLVDCESVHQPKYGTGWVSKKSEGPLYRINKPGTSGWADNLGMPPYFVNINSKGLREEPFSQNKSSNTVRILVVGDSFTFGTGVNRSDIYTEVVERKLNKEFREKNIQVINAGIPGTGMKDYYLFLKHRGLKYNPDITVIAFINNDQISAKKSNTLLHEAKSEIGKSNSTVTDYSNRSDVRRKYRDLLEKHKSETPIQNTSFSYLNNINNLTTSRNIPTIYYSLNNLEPEIDSYVREWSEELQKEIVYSPEKFREDKTNETRISKWNRHPNSKAHKAIADRLYPRLRKEILGLKNN